MPRQLFEHVIEKANSRAHFINTGPVEVHLDIDAGFIGFAAYGPDTHARGYT